MPDEQNIEKIIVPWWPGPEGDEWDSPGYHEFWHLHEEEVERRVAEARKAGKKIMLLAPGETTSTNICS